MADWSEDELRATIKAYLVMLAHQERAETYSKADFRRTLLKGPLKARTEPSIEFRMRNISAVLDQHGRSILKGYLPAANVGDKVTNVVWSIIQEFDAAPVGRLRAKPSGRDGKPNLKNQPQPPVLYFNVGWMKRYEGPADDDPTIGAHGYLGTHKHGAESHNFVVEDGLVRGVGHRATESRRTSRGLGQNDRKMCSRAS